MDRTRPIAALNVLLNGALALALILLAWGHAPRDGGGPLVYAPDGTVAVLCLAGEHDPHGMAMPECEACRIAQAMGLGTPFRLAARSGPLRLSRPARARRWPRPRGAGVSRARAPPAGLSSAL